jgi:hypothetical protein
MANETAPFQSPVEKRWLHLIGGVVLSGVMLLVTYSLIAGPSSSEAPSSDSRASDRASSSRPPSVAALSEAPDFSGTISSATTRALTIETQTGPRVVSINGDTKVIVEDGTEGTREDLTRDTGVAVVASSSDGGRTYVASEVAILPR